MTKLQPWEAAHTCRTVAADSCGDWLAALCVVLLGFADLQQRATVVGSQVPDQHLEQGRLIRLKQR